MALRGHRGDGRRGSLLRRSGGGAADERDEGQRCHERLEVPHLRSSGSASTLPGRVGLGRNDGRASGIGAVRGEGRCCRPAGYSRDGSSLAGATERVGARVAAVPLSTTPSATGCTCPSSCGPGAARRGRCEGWPVPRAAGGTGRGDRWRGAPEASPRTRCGRPARGSWSPRRREWSAAFSRIGRACCSSWFFSSLLGLGGSERSIGALATESAMFS